MTQLLRVIGRTLRPLPQLAGVWEVVVTSLILFGPIGATAFLLTRAAGAVQGLSWALATFFAVLFCLALYAAYRIQGELDAATDDVDRTIDRLKKKMFANQGEGTSLAQILLNHGEEKFTGGGLDSLSLGELAGGDADAGRRIIQAFETEDLVYSEHRPPTAPSGSGVAPRTQVEPHDAYLLTGNGKRVLRRMGER